MGWHVGAAPDPQADVVYLLAYFEAQKVQPWPKAPVAAYFTHREEEPPGNAKAKLYDEVAQRVNLRVAMCQLYGDPLSAYGPTIIPPLPVERERFNLSPVPSSARRGAIVGLSGYTYANHRKGEDLVRGIIASKPGQRAEWRASGRGWPVPTKSYSWANMPEFYRELDVLVCPSRVEGGPMPVLEALSCGVRVVVPAGVGIIDELPHVAGICRYKRGDLASMILALEQAIDLAGRTDTERERLRAAVAGHSVEAFVDAHAALLGLGQGSSMADGGIGESANQRIVESENGRSREEEIEVQIVAREPVERGTGSTRGIYCVAFGEPAREACRRMMESAKRHMPDIPICLCAAAPIGREDLLVQQPDSDVGGRRAKLMVYELAPAEWQSVLYLDADTEVTAPIYRYFEWVEDGWDLVICQDIQSMETLHIFERKACKAEVAETLRVVGTPHTLQYNGGAWSFRRGERTAAFFLRWRQEWERWAQRDQGALLRALHSMPLRVWVLGNEWNTFPKFQPGLKTAGLLHFPGDARRWGGAIPGRIDGERAWQMVRQFMEKRA